MTETLRLLLEKLSDSPLLQGLLAAGGTFVMEDPTVITCGLLIADERMGFWTAVIGLSLGITIGDMGLYLIGRWFGPWVHRKQWVSEEKFEQAKRAIERNLVIAVVGSRFLPGTRIPVFVGSGLLGACPFRFLFVAILASLLWTIFLLSVTIRLGAVLLPFLGEMKWHVLAALLTGILAIGLVKRLRNRRREAAALGEGAGG